MKQPTPYPEINKLLHHLLTNVQQVLAEQFRGLYLYGSLAGGDFNPATSDIDFVVTTANPLHTDTISALAEMHTELVAYGKWATKLEGSYITQAELRRYRVEAGPWPTLNEQKFYVAPHGSDWIIQRYILRLAGVTLAGPPPGQLIDPVTTADLRKAIAGVFHEWWLPILQDPLFLQRPDYQAFAVLSMCRALYTLDKGEVASKWDSAQWARTALPPRWLPLINQALAWPAGGQRQQQAEIRAFIKFAAGRVNERSGP